MKLKILKLKSYINHYEAKSYLTLLSFYYFREMYEAEDPFSNKELDDDTITPNHLIKHSQNTANLVKPSVINIDNKTFNPNCQWSSWSQWTSCTITCGTHSGNRKRTRSLRGSKFCSSKEETQTKFCPPVNRCPIDCVVGHWSPWTPCSQSCGTGLKSRTRSIIKQSVFGGKKCSAREADYKEVTTCVINNCAVNGEWSKWSRWSYCDASCGEGNKSRKRSCDSPKPENGGTNCTGTNHVI